MELRGRSQGGNRNTRRKIDDILATPTFEEPLRVPSDEECREIINRIAGDWHHNLLNVEVYALADKYLRPFMRKFAAPPPTASSEAEPQPDADAREDKGYLLGFEAGWNCALAGDYARADIIRKNRRPVPGAEKLAGEQKRTCEHE